MSREIAIGDIHGGLKSLVQVLDRMNYDPASDKLRFLGDYVDGWSQSSEVIQYLIELIEENPYIITLAGNHDMWAKEWLNFGMKPDGWEMNGGKTTVDSYMHTGFFFGPTANEHRKFFDNLLPYYINDDNFGFVHGGYRSEEGLGHDSLDTYTWDRKIADLIRFEQRDEIQVPKVLRAHAKVFIGHTSTVSWGTDKPMNLNQKYWNIDTGGGWWGKLTAIDVHTNEYWQSDIVKELYPNEIGR